MSKKYDRRDAELRKQAFEEMEASSKPYSEEEFARRVDQLQGIYSSCGGALEFCVEIDGRDVGFHEGGPADLGIDGALIGRRGAAHYLLLLTDDSWFKKSYRYATLCPFHEFMKGKDRELIGVIGAREVLLRDRQGKEVSDGCREYNRF